MKLFSVLAVLCLAAGCSSAGVRIQGTTGLWQFQDRQVWVKVDADGSVFQCRVAPNHQIIQSRGKLTGRTIVWEQEWAPDTVSFGKGSLTLQGQYGTFEFQPACAAMSAECIAAEA